MTIYHVRYGYGWDRPDLPGGFFLRREAAEFAVLQLRASGHADNPHIVEIEVVE
jgi:hypothetical protein